MRREERVTVQGPVKEQQPDGMSHRGLLFGFLRVEAVGDWGHFWMIQQECMRLVYTRRRNADIPSKTCALTFVCCPLGAKCR